MADRDWLAERRLAFRRRFWCNAAAFACFAQGLVTAFWDQELDTPSLLPLLGFTAALLLWLGGALLARRA